MNGLEEVQEYIQKFICEKQEIQQQIAEIENQRTQLAVQRNRIKKLDSNCAEISELGKQISELGNQSQEIQNQLDFKFLAIKTQVSSIIDNLIAEGIRKIRLCNDEIQELQEENAKQKERKERYQLQKQEFFLRFGRMPELSESAINENKKQEEKCKNNVLQISKIGIEINEITNRISKLATTKKNFKNGNWNLVVGEENTSIAIEIEPLYINEMEPIEEIIVEPFEQIEEVYIEAFNPTLIEEIQIKEFKEDIIESQIIETELKTNTFDEIEQLARAIVEEIASQQTANISQVETSVENIMESEDIVSYEQETEKSERVIIPLFGQRAKISNIVVKIEEGELVYKAQMSDDKEVKIYPAQLGGESVLLRDKQNREECKEILINYAVSEYKIFDKKVVNKIDPLICELLIECAERYGFDAQELVYNYAMSFVSGDLESVPGIVYNISYINQSSLSRKEKAIINKICRNASKNNGIDVIESFSGFKKVKYVFKRLLAVNNVKVLPEAKY